MPFTATGRPWVWQVFCALPPIEATRVYARLGYTQGAISCTPSRRIFPGDFRYHFAPGSLAS